MRAKCVFKHQDYKYIGLKFDKCEQFPPIEVLGRARETQLQVGAVFVEIYIHNIL